MNSTHRAPLLSKLGRRDALKALAALALPMPNALSAAAATAGKPTSSAAAAAPGLDRPDLANLHGILDSIAGERAAQMSFLDSRWKSLEEWKQAARPVFRARLSYEPQAVPLKATRVSIEERDGFTVETINISATSAYQIPARVLVPKNRRGRLPAVLALHCHSGRYTWGHEKVLSTPGESPIVTEFRNGTYGRPWAEVLVRRGYVVIAIDALYFGERRLRVEELDPERVPSEAAKHHAAALSSAPGSAEWIDGVNRTCRFYEHLTAKTIFAAGATWPGVHAWDERRTIDYLQSRADVDPDRIGCVGLSGGGFRTALAIASDSRIKASVVTGWMTEFRHQLRKHLHSHTWMVYVPGLYPDLDLPDAAALHAPGALLVQQCSRDRLYPMSGMKGAVEKLSRIYAKAGIPDRFKGSFHDVPHSFRPEMQDEAFDWLDRWL